MYLTLVPRRTLALDQLQLLEALEQRRQRAGIQGQSLAQRLDGGLLRRGFLPLPQH
ncbi:hypothetical protein D3C85_1749190 [compost metagenome]